MFLDSTSVTVPLPQWVVQRASGGFTHTSSPTVILACSCSTLSVMAQGCHQQIDVVPTLCPGQSSVPCYTRRLLLGVRFGFFQPQLLWFDGTSLIPLPLGQYTDLKYHLTPHFSHSSLKTYEQEPTLLSTGPLSRNASSTALSISFTLFWFFTIPLLSLVHGKPWIDMVHGDNAGYQWPAAYNFLPHAAPLFCVWMVQGQWIDTPYITPLPL